MEIKNQYLLPQELVDELESSLNAGPLIEEDEGQETHMILEWCVDSFGGVKILLHPNDHPPPHFHVQYNGEDNSFRLDNGEPLHPNNGLKSYFKNIKKWHTKNAKLIIAAYNNGPSPKKG